MATYYNPYYYSNFQPRSEVSLFNGDGVDQWLHQIECFFIRYQTLPDQKLAVADRYLTGEALEWYQQWHREMWWRWFQLPKWDEFVRDLKSRFKPPEIQTSIREVIDSDWFRVKLHELKQLMSETRSQPSYFITKSELVGSAPESTDKSAPESIVNSAAVEVAKDVDDAESDMTIEKSIESVTDIVTESDDEDFDLDVDIYLDLEQSAVIDFIDEVTFDKFSMDGSSALLLSKDDLCHNESLSVESSFFVPSSFVKFCIQGVCQNDSEDISSSRGRLCILIDSQPCLDIVNARFKLEWLRKSFLFPPVKPPDDGVICWVEGTGVKPQSEIVWRRIGECDLKLCSAVLCPVSKSIAVDTSSTVDSFSGLQTKQDTMVKKFIHSVLAARGSKNIWAKEVWNSGITVASGVDYYSICYIGGSFLPLELSSIKFQSILRRKFQLEQDSSGLTVWVNFDDFTSSARIICAEFDGSADEILKVIGCKPPNELLIILQMVDNDTTVVEDVGYDNWYCTEHWSLALSSIQGNESLFWTTTSTCAGVRLMMKLRITLKQDLVLCQVPQYRRCSESIALYGVTLVFYYLNELTEWGLEVLKLQRKLDASEANDVTSRAMVVINHGNPTRNVSADDDWDIGEFCRKKCLVLLIGEVVDSLVINFTPTACQYNSVAFSSNLLPIFSTYVISDGSWYFIISLGIHALYARPPAKPPHDSSKVLSIEFCGNVTLDMPVYAVVDDNMYFEICFYGPRTSNLGDGVFTKLLLLKEQTLTKKVATDVVMCVIDLGKCTRVGWWNANIIRKLKEMVDDTRLVWGFDKTMSHFAEIILRYTNLNGEVGLDEVNIMKFNRMHDMKRMSSLPANFHQGVHILSDKVERVIVFDCIVNLPCCLIIGGCGWIEDREIMKAQALRGLGLDIYMSNKKITEINRENSIMDESRKIFDAEKKDKCAMDLVMLFSGSVLLQLDFNLDDLNPFENKNHQILKLGLTTEEIDDVGAVYQKDIIPLKVCHYNKGEKLMVHDYIALSHDDFIIKSTYQKVAGTSNSVGQFESDLSFTFPRPYRVAPDIDEEYQRLPALSEFIKEMIYKTELSGDGSRSLRDQSKPIHVSKMSLDQLKDLVMLAFQSAFLASGFSLDKLVSLMSFISKIFLFSLPRPPEMDDLEDKVDFKGVGMLRNGILRNLEGYLYFGIV